MANKRMNSDNTQIAPKVVIGNSLELPEDIILLEENVNSQINMILQYDTLFEKFFIMIKKQLEMKRGLYFWS